MAGSLTDFALRLALDPNELERYRSSPDAARETMRAAGLSDAEQLLMLSGDQRRICDALTADAAPAVGAATVRVEEAMEIRPETPEPMEMPPAEPMEMPPSEPMEMPPTTAHAFARS